jgi:hypothetical protein
MFFLNEQNYTLKSNRFLYHSSQYYFTKFDSHNDYYVLDVKPEIAEEDYNWPNTGRVANKKKYIERGYRWWYGDKESGLNLEKMKKDNINYLKYNLIYFSFNINYQSILAGNKDYVYVCKIKDNSKIFNINNTSDYDSLFKIDSDLAKQFKQNKICFNEPISNYKFMKFLIDNKYQGYLYDEEMDSDSTTGGFLAVMDLNIIQIIKIINASKICDKLEYKKR